MHRNQSLSWLAWRVCPHSKPFARLLALVLSPLSTTRQSCTAHSPCSDPGPIFLHSCPRCLQAGSGYHKPLFLLASQAHLPACSPFWVPSQCRCSPASQARPSGGCQCPCPAPCSSHTQACWPHQQSLPSHCAPSFRWPGPGWRLPVHPW